MLFVMLDYYYIYFLVILLVELENGWTVVMTFCTQETYHKIYDKHKELMIVRLEIIKNVLMFYSF